jgi:ABC-type protease/lipase transport system fused ATPase/permease subunit
VARMAGVHDRIKAIPDGYQTRVDAIGSIFSKSERHQIALARALYPDPLLLIVDEPDTSFRDALRTEINGAVGDLLDRGGILVMLTRVPSKHFRATQSFTLDAGVLREIKPDHAIPMKVVAQNG